MVGIGCATAMRLNKKKKKKKLKLSGLGAGWWSCLWSTGWACVCRRLMSIWPVAMVQWGSHPVA